MFHSLPPPPLDRRDMLHRLGAGFGVLGLAGVLAEDGGLGTRVSGAPLAAKGSHLAPKAPHFAPRAKRVIQLFMPGGPSQVDTFDYKPEIRKYQGKRPEIVDRKSFGIPRTGSSPLPSGSSSTASAASGSAKSFPMWVSASTTSASSIPCTRTSRSTPAPS